MLTSDVENYPGFPENITGPDLMAEMIKQAKRFGSELIYTDVTEVDFSKQPFTLTTESEHQIQQIVGVHHKGIGSIEGRIEIVSIRQGGRRFNLYHAISQRAIRCNLPEEIEADVFKAAEKRRRVVASGIISYNVKGEPLSLLVRRPIRFLKYEDELPTVENMLGVSEDITGDFSTEDYIRSIRDG